MVDPASTSAIAHLLLKVVGATIRSLSPSALESAGDESLRGASSLLLQHKSKLTDEDIIMYKSQVEAADMLRMRCLNYKTGGTLKRCNLGARIRISRLYRQRCVKTAQIVQRTTDAAVRRACSASLSEHLMATNIELEIKTPNGQIHHVLVRFNKDGFIDYVDSVEGLLLIKSFKSTPVPVSTVSQLPSDGEQTASDAPATTTSASSGTAEHPNHIPTASDDDNTNSESSDSDVASLMVEIDDELEDFEVPQTGIFEFLTNELSSLMDQLTSAVSLD